MSFLYNYRIKDSKSNYNLVGLHPGQIGKFNVPEGSFINIEKFFNFIKNKNLGLAETFNENQSRNLYFDFDISEESDQLKNLYTIEEVKQVIKDINNILIKTTNVKPENLQCIFLSKSPYFSNNKIKHGFHLHYPNIFFENNEDNKKYLYEFIQENLSVLKDQFDVNVYKAPWLLYGNSKSIDKKPYLINSIYDYNLNIISLKECIKDERFIKKIFEVEENNLSFLLCLNTYLNCIENEFIKKHLIELKETYLNIIKTQKDIKEQKQLLSQIKREECVLNISDDDKVKFIKELLDVLNIDRSENYQSWRNIAFILKAELDENNALSLLHYFSQKCISKYDESSVESFFSKITSSNLISLGTLIYYALEDNGLETKKILKKHSFNKLNNYTSSNITVKRINNKLSKIITKNEVYDRTTFSFEDSQIFIKANIGSGKTTQLLNYIKDKNDVIYVTPRVTLADEFYDKLKNDGYQHYQDVKDFSKTNKLIIQIDSLFKTEFPYKIAVFDEIETTLSYLVDNNIMKNKSDVIFYLKNLLQHCNQLIFLDANLTEETMNLIKQITNKDTYIQKCQYKSFKDKPVKLIIGSKAKDVKETLFKEVIQDIKDGKKINIPLNSKKFMKELESSLKTHSSKLKVIKVSSEDKISTIEEFKENDVSIYTGALLCGNNFDYKHFDKTIAYFSNAHSSAKLISQQLLRVRQFDEMVIYFHENNLIKKRISEKELLETWKNNRNEREQRGIKYDLSYNVFEENWYFNLSKHFILELINSSSTMIDDLVNILLNHGFNITCDQLKETNEECEIELKNYKLKEDYLKIINAKNINKEDLLKRDTLKEEKDKYYIEYNLNINLKDYNEEEAINLIKKYEGKYLKHKNYSILMKYGVEKTKEIKKKLEEIKFNNISKALVRPQELNNDFIERKGLDFIEKYNIIDYVDKYEIRKGKMCKNKIKFNKEEFIQWFNQRNEFEEKCKFEKIDESKNIKNINLKINKLLNTWGIKYVADKKYITTLIDYTEFNINTLNININYDWVFQKSYTFEESDF